MGFFFKNITKRAVIAKIRNSSFEFVLRVVEEVTLNVTAPDVANATEIPTNITLNLLPKDQIITSTYLAVSSKI